MLKMFLSFLLIINSMIMYFLNHPLSMGLFILFQTLLTCLMSGMMIKTYWFSYILFLTFLGGLMVLFIYVSSIASNEILYWNKVTNFFLLLIIMSMMMSIMFMYNLKLMNFNFNSDMMNFFNNMLLENNNNLKMNMNKLYNNNMSMLLMFLMIIYLFITLLAVVKITNIFYGPLRSSSN